MASKLLLASSFLISVIIIIFVGHVGVVSTSRPLPKDNQNNHRHQVFVWHEVFPIPGAIGPETLAFDNHGGGPYAGVSDGRIIKWQGNESRWINFATTTSNRDGCEGPHDHTRTESRCGRPLGLSFDQNSGNLYIADAYMGLLVVGPYGGLATPLAKEAQGVPFKFLNDVVVDQSSGLVYFTDSSTRYQRRKYAYVMLSGDHSGRLLKFDPKTHEVTVLLDNLMFPNGVALSKNRDFLLVADTTNSRILRFWLEPSKFGKVEIFKELPGRPDNIKSNEKGEFWAAANAEKRGPFSWVLSISWLRKLLTKLPIDLAKVTAFLGGSKGYGLAIRLGENGDILEIVEDKLGGTWKYISDVDERNGNLWIGSVTVPFTVKLHMPSSRRS